MKKLAPVETVAKNLKKWQHVRVCRCLCCFSLFFAGFCQNMVSFVCKLQACLGIKINNFGDKLSDFCNFSIIKNLLLVNSSCWFHQCTENARSGLHRIDLIFCMWLDIDVQLQIPKKYSSEILPWRLYCIFWHRNFLWHASDFQIFFCLKVRIGVCKKKCR